METIELSGRKLDVAQLAAEGYRVIEVACREHVQKKGRTEVTVRSGCDKRTFDLSNTDAKKLVSRLSFETDIESEDEIEQRRRLA